MFPRANTGSVPLQLCYLMCISSSPLSLKGLYTLHCITSRLSHWIPSFLFCVLFPFIYVRFCLLSFFFSSNYGHPPSLSYPLTLQSKNAWLSASPQPPQLQKQQCDSELSGQSCHTPLGQSTVMVIMITWRRRPSRRRKKRGRDMEATVVVKWEEDKDVCTLRSTICTVKQIQFTAHKILIKCSPILKIMSTCFINS